MIVRRFKKFAAALRRDREARNTPQGIERAIAAQKPAETAPAFTPAAKFDWQILQAPTHQTYEDIANPDLLKLLRFEPAFALEVGCNAGRLGQMIKERFPRCKVWGVEPNEVTAQMARSRLDRVLNCPLEQVAWQSEGVRRGEIDTVFLFDVLEHIFDPWGTLLNLRNLVSANAQVLISVPNVRNLFLIQDLIRGHWRYREMGLLDITHIRFFTEQDLMRMIYQTGFRVMSRNLTFCDRSAEVYQRFTGRSFPQVLELDGAAIEIRSEQDLVSYCTLQHIVNLAPADYAQLSPQERLWIDAPHPETEAYAGLRP